MLRNRTLFSLTESDFFLTQQGKGEMTTWWLVAKRNDHTDFLLETSESKVVPVPVSD